MIRAGRLEEGIAQVRGALPGIAGLRDPELVVEVLSSLAWFALGAEGDESARRAAVLIYAATALREREGLALRAADRAELDELIALVTAQLGEPALLALRAEAKAIDLDAGIALAIAALDGQIEGGTTSG